MACAFAINRRFLCWLLTAALLTPFAKASAEPLRIAYTSIAVVYGPLWLTKEAGLFKKYNIEPEFIYIAGGPPSLQALIAGDVAISFTAGGATVAANLNGSDVVLLGASIDSLPFELWSAPNIKSPEQLKGTRLGVSRIGATTDFVARYLLKKWNLQSDKDVAIFQTGSGPQVFAAMKGGSVQSGVLSTGPETLNAEATGYFRLADVAASGLVYPFGPFAARQAFLKSQPDLVMRFYQGLRRRHAPIQNRQGCRPRRFGEIYQAKNHAGDRKSLPGLRDEILQTCARSDAGRHPNHSRRNLRHSPAAAGHRPAAVRRVAIYPRTGFHRLRRRAL
jgi:NitT/TauT family transport system substrate-binding protein